MDEYHMNGMDGQPPKENPFKSGAFYTAFLATILVLGVIIFLNAKDAAGYWPLVLFFLCAPCAVLGLIIWAVVRRRSRHIALGILLGSLAPLVVVFVMTGSCMLGLV